MKFEYYLNGTPISRVKTKNVLNDSYTLHDMSSLNGHTDLSYRDGRKNTLLIRVNGIKTKTV